MNNTDTVGHFEQSQNERASRVDQHLGVLEDAINTRQTRLNGREPKTFRKDMNAMDYEFAKMTSCFI